MRHAWLLAASMPAANRADWRSLPSVLSSRASGSWVLDDRGSLNPHYSVHIDSCPAGMRNAGQDECLAAVHEAAGHSGHEVAGLKPVHEGVDGHVPRGCSYSLVSQDAIFNTHDVGGSGATDKYQLVCFQEASEAPTSVDGESVSASRRFAIVVPIHRPKFDAALDLLESFVACKQYEQFVMLLVFSSQDDLDVFMATDDERVRPKDLYAAGRIVHLVARCEDDARCTKPRMFNAYRGLVKVFREMPEVTHAITINANSEFTSTKDFSAFFDEWSRQQLVAVSTEQDAEGPISHCKAINLNSTHSEVSVRLGDAPVFERRGFEDFISRVSLTDDASWDDIAYSCYNVEVRGWKPVDTTNAIGRTVNMAVGLQSQVREILHTTHSLPCHHRRAAPPTTLSGCCDHGNWLSILSAVEGAQPRAAVAVRR